MDITLTAADGHAFTAYLCGPEDARTGVVVLPEIFGINGHIRQMADRFAAQGYRAICPSLFDRAADGGSGLQLGYDEAGRDRGLALRKAIRDEDALLDIEAAAAALKGQVARLVTGYCWGGYLSWRAACLSDTFAAASCWYGGGIARHAHALLCSTLRAMARSITQSSMVPTVAMVGHVCLGALSPKAAA